MDTTPRPVPLPLPFLPFVLSFDPSNHSWSVSSDQNSHGPDQDHDKGKHRLSDTRAGAAVDPLGQQSSCRSGIFDRLSWLGSTCGSLPIHSRSTTGLPRRHCLHLVQNSLYTSPTVHLCGKSRHFRMLHQGNSESCSCVDPSSSTSVEIHEASVSKSSVVALVVAVVLPLPGRSCWAKAASLQCDLSFSDTLLWLCVAARG